VVAACLERHRARAEAKNQLLEAVFSPADGPLNSALDVGKGTPLSVASSLAHPVRVPSHPAVISSSSGVPPTGIVAWADEEAVSQILDNLVDNALKYTPEGGRISVRCRADNGQVCLEVEDTGIGIAEADLPRIFERFYRVDKARSREMGGTGLGLAIVKHLVGAMHGTLGAVSQPGQGTKFSIVLPAPAAS
jgi:two-component system phosphate regulon sensor histidine kinase PhoR